QHVEVPAGKHLLKVERAGFYPYAEVIELAPRKPAKASITLAATPTASSLNQIIAGASDEVNHGSAGKSVAQLAQKFSLERVLIGSVRSQEETKVSVVLALVDAVKHKVIASKTLMLAADGTDADQIEADTSAAARKLIAADDAEPSEAQPVAEAKPAADAPRRVAVPSAAPAPTADEPGIVAKERKVAVPATTAPAAKDPEPAAPASKEAEKKSSDKKKSKSKGIQSKTGTEEWGDD
ncbi:MAG: hypothetical protein ACXWLM_09435, partial [Myxococcales bacterium]